MATSSKRAKKSLETSRSVSEFVDSAVKQTLADDVEDITVFESRKNEPVVSFSDMVKQLKSYALI